MSLERQAQQKSYQMRSKLISLAVMAALTVPLAAPAPSYALSDEDKAKIAGTLLGLAVARRLQQRQQENKAIGEPYIAAPNVRCFPEVRKCYWNNVYSSRWTRHEF
jgi:hypothetical protein